MPNLPMAVPHVHQYHQYPNLNKQNNLYHLKKSIIKYVLFLTHLYPIILIFVEIFSFLYPFLRFLPIQLVRGISKNDDVSTALLISRYIAWTKNHIFESGLS